MRSEYRPSSGPGCELIEGVGVVAAPLLVRADDVDEPRVGRVAPHVDVEGDLEDREDPLVSLEHRLLVPRRVRSLEELGLEPAHLVHELVEDSARVEVGPRQRFHAAGSTLAAR
jgi:hypothetical protein